QQLASVDCLKIECRFTTRLQPQDPLRKKSIRAVAINTEAARTVNEIRSELELEQMQQIWIGNLAIVATKVRPGTFTLDVDAPQSCVTQKAVISRQRQQSQDARLRQQPSLGAAVQMPFLLAHKSDLHFQRRRGVFEILSVVIATHDLSLDSPRCNRASEFVDVIGSDCLGIVTQHQRARQVQTLSSAARDLVKVMLFFQQRVGRDVFECQAVLAEPIALFVWIDPIARRTQRETAFNQSGNKDSTKAQTADIRRFEHAQTIAIGCAKDLRLRNKRAAHFLKESREPNAIGCLCAELDALDGGDKGATQFFQGIEVEHHLRQ